MGVWVFAEIVDGTPDQGALEITSKAATLGETSVFCLGVPSDPPAGSLVGLRIGT